MMNIKYEVLTETDDLYRFEAEKRLSDEEIAKRLGIDVEDLVQVDFDDAE